MDNLTQTAIGTTIRLNMDYGSALARVTEALKAEGFGVLTEIDVKEILKNCTLARNWRVDPRQRKILRLSASISHCSGARALRLGARRLAQPEQC